MDTIQLKKEFQYRTARSGGKGGQNVNKLETKVELFFNLQHSEAFSADEKYLIATRLANRINGDGYLAVVNQTERTQISNKLGAEKKVFKLLKDALMVDTPRIESKPPPSAERKRVKQKKILGSIKTLRKKVRTDYDSDFFVSEY